MLEYSLVRLRDIQKGVVKKIKMVIAMVLLQLCLPVYCMLCTQCTYKQMDLSSYYSDYYPDLLITLFEQPGRDLSHMRWIIFADKSRKREIMATIELLFFTVCNSGNTELDCGKEKRDSQTDSKFPWGGGVSFLLDCTKPEIFAQLMISTSRNKSLTGIKPSVNKPEVLFALMVTLLCQLIQPV